MTQETEGPLSGLTVVAVEQAVAAPFCTGRLADAGATVLKIERPEGDFARGYDTAAKGQASYFVWLNRGKKSVVLDLASEEGRRDLHTLIADADILVQNLKPGAMERLGFGTEALRKEFSALIVCSISGYGDTGPYADRKAYDLLIQAESGLASVTGAPSAPGRVGISIVDVATGATAHAAILEAVLQRYRTGRGADIRISMFDVIAEWLAVPLLNAEAGSPPKRLGLAHPSIAPYGAYRTADGAEILIAIRNEREWDALCRKVFDRSAMATDERLSSNVARVRNRQITDDAVGAAVADMPSETLVQRLADAQIAFAEVNDMAGLSAHPHLRRIAVATPNGMIDVPAPAPLVDGRTQAASGVPALGEHTDGVLDRLRES